MGSMDMQVLIWVICGIILILSEFIVPGVILVFFGISCLVVALLISLGMPTGNGEPFLLVGILSILQILLLRNHLSRYFRGRVITDDPDGEQEGDFIGREATVIGGFGETNHHKGTVDFHGSTWSAKCMAPLEPGEVVIIRGRKGLTLLVEKSPSKTN